MSAGLHFCFSLTPADNYSCIEVHIFFNKIIICISNAQVPSLIYLKNANLLLTYINLIEVASMQISGVK